MIGVFPISPCQPYSEFWQQNWKAARELTVLKTECVVAPPPRPRGGGGRGVKVRQGG